MVNVEVGAGTHWKQGKAQILRSTRLLPTAVILLVILVGFFFSFLSYISPLYGVYTF